MEGRLGIRPRCAPQTREAGLPRRPPPPHRVPEYQPRPQRMCQAGPRVPIVQQISALHKPQSRTVEAELRRPMRGGRWDAGTGILASDVYCMRDGYKDLGKQGRSGWRAKSGFEALLELGWDFLLPHSKYRDIYWFISFRKIYLLSFEGRLSPSYRCTFFM